MLRIRVSTASAEITETELITAGRRGLECAFEFNSAWDGLAKTVIVNGVVKRDIVLVSDTITVPGECLAREQFPLRIGVYGANGAGEIVIPTIWANFGKILPSARPSGVSPDEVTPDVVAQIQTNSSDALRLAQEVMRRADSGEFNGRDGATGPSGEAGQDGAPGNSIWWAPTSARIVDAFVTLERLSGRQGIPPQSGDLVFFEDYEVYKISIVGQYRAAIDRLGSIIGPKGDQGDAFTYEDFTEAQLAALTGPQGPVGPAGNPGEDGFSPEVSVTTITGGHRVTITDAQGAHTFDVMDGEDSGSAGVTYYSAAVASDGTLTMPANMPTPTEIKASVGSGASLPLLRIYDRSWTNGSDQELGHRNYFYELRYAERPALAPIFAKFNNVIKVPSSGELVFVEVEGVEENGSTTWTIAKEALGSSAAPVQSVNGQTGNVTIPALPTGGTAGQILKLMPGFLPGSDPLPIWSDPQTVIFDFTLDANDHVSSGPIWNDIDAAVIDAHPVVAHVTKNDGAELFAPLVYYNGTSGAWTAKFSAANGYDGLFYSIVPGEGVVNTWVYNEWDINADLTDLYDSKLDNNLGSSQAGKFLVVGSDGAVTTMTLATWQGGSY